MKNTDIFSPNEGYDMVVSVTQKTINDQIAILANPDIGIIKTSLIFGMTRNKDRTFDPKFYDSWESVPGVGADGKGSPNVPVMNAQYLPRLQIKDSGTTAVLVLEFPSGVAWYVDPIDGLSEYDVKDWKYGIAIDLNFAGISRADLAAGKAVPPIVSQKLEHFMDQDFSISQLFADLTNVNLMRSDQEITTVGTAGDAVLQSFTYFMNTFLGDLQKHPEQNPYILGYSVAAVSATPDEDKNVPDSLKPIGSTFTLYKDPNNSDLSNVNFCLNTKGGQGKGGFGTHATPGNFDSNWIGSAEQCQAKMIYSAYCLLETLVLKPFYDGYANSTHDVISKAGVNIPNVPDYHAAMSSNTDGKKWSIAAQGGDDMYHNSYAVAFTSDGPNLTLKLSGGLDTKKSVSQNDFFCTASAWVSGYVNWEATIVVTADKNDKGEPTLRISNPPPKITSSGHDSWMNDCCKAFSWIAKIIGVIGDALSLGLDNNFFQNLFNNLLVPTASGIFNPVSALGSTGTTVNGSLLLPAGQIFFFKNPSADADGNVSLELTYKTETGTAASLAAVSKVEVDHSRFQFIETPYSRVTKLIKPASKATKPLLGAAPEKKTAAPAVPNPYAQPLKDKFKFDCAKSAAGTGKCDVGISCELMANSLPGMPVMPSKEFSLAQDAKGNALIFALSSDAQFNVLISDSDADGTGFRTVNLGASFHSFKAAVCFAVSQDEAGLISIAFTLVDQTGVQGVFYAPRLSNDLISTDFSKMSAMATQITGYDPKFTVENLMVGASDDGQRPVLLVQGQLGLDKSFYQLQASDSTPLRVEFPENVGRDGSGLLSMKMGYAFGRRTNYFLYTIGETVSLVGKTIPSGGSGSSTFDYSPGNKTLPVAFQHLSYNSITTATSRAGINASSDILIAAASGIYRIPNAKAASMECVTDQIKDAHEIFVAATATTISLWVVASPNILWYIYGAKVSNTTNITWNAPVQFAKGVIHVAGMRSRVTNANEIFTINQDMSISRYWQDPVTTIWRSKTELVPGSKYVLNYNSFTSVIHLERNGLPLVGEKLMVSSNEWQYYAINGSIYSLDVDTAAELVADPQGNVTIISTAIDVAPAVLHVQSALFKETLNIYPNGKVNHHLQKVTDGASLQSAQAQDGTPVMDPKVTGDVANAVASNVSQVNTVGASSYPPAAQGNIFTAVETPVASGENGHLKHSALRTIKTTHLEDGVVCGMTVRDGKWQLHKEGQAEKLLSVHRDSAVLGSFFGDFWHWIENFADDIVSNIENGVVKLIDGTTFIIHKVEEGLEFVLVLADKTLRIALSTLGAVFKALNWILKLVGIDLAKILAWLGHLLGWDRIWATHQMISGIGKNFLDFAKTNGPTYIELARRSAKSFFAEIDLDVKNAILPASVKNDSPDVAANSTDQGPDTRSMATSPPANYATYHLQHSATSANQDQKIGNVSTNGTVQTNGEMLTDDPFTQFYNDVLQPAFDVISEKLGKTSDDLLKLITDMSLDNLRILLADVADALISVMATVVDGFLHFAEDILKDIIGLLEEELDIPVIGALWDFMCELFGSSEPFTVMNASAFLLAIPAVTVVKLATGTTPDQFNNGFDDPAFPAKVAKWLGSGSPLNLTAAKTSGKLAVTNKQDEEYKAPPELKAFSLAEGCISPFAAIVGTVCDAAKANGSKNEYLQKVSLGTCAVKALFSWPVTDDGQDWNMYAIRWVAFVLGAAGDLMPGCPPKAKVVVNAVLAILAIVVDAKESQDPFAWTSDICGTISSLVAEAGEGNAEVQVPAYAASIMFGSLVALSGGIVKSIESRTESTAATANVKKSWKSICVGGA
ncbi:hypothetical protein LTR78_007079 [Recurvomyces mirabilis]|uniref:Uncharacterized protein n=1 Tax=Recurvomyces mirabilis TaxID=574656 RepID=A0AAE0WJP9_9PEZI|nr:hypothetical protein LTR78_007079 [Recurvomyces mirabilis]